jgi:hypothetical protein
VVINLSLIIRFPLMHFGIPSSEIKDSSIHC